MRCERIAKRAWTLIRPSFGWSVTLRAPTGIFGVIVGYYFGRAHEADIKTRPKFVEAPTVDRKKWL